LFSGLSSAIDKENQVWARVRTSYRTETVVEVDGEKYLVALDGQVVHLWEKEWGLKKT
jgi:hypothetical protein